MHATPTARYRIVELLAAGGMGIVYRAEDVRLHRPVALKFLTPETVDDEEYRARFVREARIAARLNHPNTCAVYEVGEVGADRPIEDLNPPPAPGTLFIAMELIDGETLAQRLSRAGRLSPPEIVDIALQIASGLAEAHAQQIVHRDLKPHNVMVTGGGRVKIVDFGLAKPIKPLLQHAAVSTSDMISADLGSGMLIGTCSYMSPEQASGKLVDARSDVFSFGIMLYEMVAGRRPFRGDTATEILARILEADPEPLVAVTVPASLTRIIWRCLNKNADDRYRDTRELVADLHRVHDRVTRKAGRSGLWPDLPRRLAGRRGELIAAALLLLFAVPIGYFWMQLRGRDEVGREPAVASPVAAAPEVSLPPEPFAPGPITAPQSDINTSGPGSEDPQSERQKKRAQPQKGEESSSPGEGSAGTLIVTSRPRASVVIDGTLVGLTPLTLAANAGTREITLTSPDGLRWRGRVDVTNAATITLDRDLQAAGRLTVTSDVWVHVSLDGAPAEETPIHFPRIAAGLHDIRASRDGYVTKTLEVFIEEGETVALKVELEKAP